MPRKTLLEQAQAFYERDDFENARTYYRKAFLRQEPSRFEMSCLGTSEHYSHRHFLKHLTILYPNSFDIKMRYIQSQSGSNNKIVWFTKMLENDILTQEQEARIRLLRFGANCHFLSRRVEQFVEDFQKLWPPNAKSSKDKGWRRILIRVIIKDFNGPDAVPALEELLRRTELPEDVKDLFQGKIDQLRRLEKVLDALL